MIKRILVTSLLMVLSTLPGFGQAPEGIDGIKRAVLLSPIGADGIFRGGKQWVQMLPGHGQLNYGNRFGDNWDILALSNGNTSQHRMIELGEYDWTDKFDAPYIKPARRLKAGETRSISVNTSGTRAPDGKTYGNSTVENQSKAAVKDESGTETVDDYQPYVAARKGYMYLFRVVDPEVDQYFLIRVDDVERGEKLYISFKKIDAPKTPIL